MELVNNFEYKDFLIALIQGDRKNGSEIINSYLNKKISIKELYENLIKLSLYRVGELWEHNQISVATEHLATAVTESLLNNLFEQIVSNERVGKTAVVGCVENEFHQVGIKMVADLFEMNGWDTHFLGANIPTHELIRFTKETNPDIIALSLSIYFHLPILEKMITEFRSQFPKIPIIIGGQAFVHGGDNITSKFNNVMLLKDLNQIETYINKT